MRKKMVAGNWKMNLGMAEAKDLTENILKECRSLSQDQLVVFCVPYIHLHTVADVIAQANHKQVKLGAQNCHDKQSGAYTGEISAAMLKECGVSHVIIGHSERRQYFHESNEFLKAKTNTLIAQSMQVIFCCGEPLEIRNAGTQNEYVADQLKESLFHLSAADLQGHITIAYEPIWAIGTGVTATTEQAQEMHFFIRGLLRAQYGNDLADKILILYGGSCNAQNAQELFANPDVDGGLIGGAALKAETFLPVIQAMN
ncbi:MAG: triose-phosphate isomerase [Chitinophagaceae bacterium]|nr:triose-phosphate isomerase [Chitinophagaceae bacterium]